MTTQPAHRFAASPLPVLLVLLCLALPPGAASAAEWPAWLGPEDNRVAGPGDYPVVFNAESADWKIPLPGKASSTPIVAGDRIYLTGPADGMDTVTAFDHSGEVVWQTQLGPETPGRHQRLGSGANASPTTDGSGLFVYFKSGTFAALELDGAVRWQRNVVEEFGEDEMIWDQGSSPVVTDDHVILARMHAGESWVGAFDKATGETVWMTPRNYEAPVENDNGYATPVRFQHHGEEALLVWGADHLTAYRAADGVLLWECGGFNPEGTAYWPPIATPAIVGDLVVVPVGRDDRPDQASLHAIRLGGEGDVTDTHRVWVREDLGIYVPTPVHHEGRVYLLRHRGEVVCLDPETGETVWSGELPRAAPSYYSSPLIAGDRLYAAREDGAVFVLGLGGDGFELLAENSLDDRIVASPVPLGTQGLLFRGDEHFFHVTNGAGGE